MTANFDFDFEPDPLGAWEPAIESGRTDESRYRALFAAGDSEVLKGIWHDAYGSNFALEADSFGFATRADFEYAAENLQLGPGDRFLDIGCGGGGPGLWISQLTGASVFGVDIAPEAAAAARRRALDRGAQNASFLAVDCTATGLTERLDGAVAFDSLWMVMDKVAAFEEAARLLPVGGKLIVTTWEPPYLDYEELLDRAGFDTLERFVPADWRRPQLAIYKAILERREEVERELGAAAAQILLDEAIETPPLLIDTERVRLLAARR